MSIIGLYGLLSFICFALAIYTFRKGHPYWILGLVILNCGLANFAMVLSRTPVRDYLEAPIFSNLLFPIGLLVFYRNLHTSKLSRSDKCLLFIACLEFLGVLFFHTLYHMFGDAGLQWLPKAFFDGVLRYEPHPESSLLDIVSNSQAITFFFLQIAIFPVVLYHIWQELIEARNRHLNFFTQDSFEYYSWNFRFVILVAFCYVVIGGIIAYDLLFHFVHFYRRIAYIFIGLGGLGLGLLGYLSPSYLKKSPELPLLIRHYENENGSNTEVDDGNKYEKYKAQLSTLLKTEKLYTDPNLTLHTLAERMDISARHLSRIINDGYEKNFSDFINGYRVAEIKQNLLNPAYDHYNILSVGLEAGFNSKSSFYAAFKKETGTNPAQFKKESRQK